MWVYRAVLYIKPGLMAEAIANLTGNPLPVGMRRRLLRPLNGAEAANQLIQEFEIEDVDAAVAGYGRPGPQSESSKRFVELNQNRGYYELYRVVHAVPGDGSPGAWLQRRVRWMKPGGRNEWVNLVRASTPFSWAGYSHRLLYPRTGTESGDILVDECTFSSLTEHDAVIREVTSRPENLEVVKKLGDLERRQNDVELYRIVE